MAWLGLITDEEGNENWSARTGARSRPKTRKGVGELGNCYGASPGTLGRNFGVLGERGRARRNTPELEQKVHG